MYIVSKYLPHKILTSYNGNFTVNKSRREHLNQMTKGNITNNGTNQNQMPPERIQ